MRSTRLKAAFSISILAFATSAAAAAEIPVGPDLGLSFLDLTDSFGPGSLITYELRYSNHSDLPATGVIILETVPEHAAFQAGSSSPGWACADGAGSGTPCLFALGDLPALAEGTLLFSVVVSDPLPGDVSDISNTAAISDDGSQGIDPAIEDNWASIVLSLGSGGGEDPEGEVCHPVAQRIADAVNSLGEENSDYTCEDILDMFNGSLTDAQLGFGRMLRAYSLAEDGINLPWETILQWHLDGNGWGTLMQLNRLAGEAEGYSLEDLIDLVDSQIRVVLIRFALMLVDKYDADFDAALDQLVNHGEGHGVAIQLFRIAQVTGLTPEEVQALLEEGYRLSEIRQAARLAEGDPELMSQILEMGLATYRQSQHEPQGNDNQNQQQENQNERTAAQIAERYQVTTELVMSVFNGECQENWPCVREHFRQNYEKPRGNNKD